MLMYVVVNFNFYGQERLNNLNCLSSLVVRLRCSSVGQYLMKDILRFVLKLFQFSD